MTLKRLLSRRSRPLAFLLLAVAVLPAATLLWLGLQLLQQERSLQDQRTFERQQAAMSAVVRSLEGSLADAERHGTSGPVPDGMARLTFSAEGVDAEPADRVLWLPGRDAIPDAEARGFADAERLEFQGHVAGALVAYQEAARSTAATVRAGALLRLARIRRGQRRWDEALATYAQLARITGVAIEGAPSELQARRASCSVLEQMGSTGRLRASASALETDLLAARWRLDRPAWDLTAADLARWLGRPVQVPPQRRLFSAAADQLWQRRLRETESVRRFLVSVNDAMVTVLQQPRDARVVALVVSPETAQGWADGAVSRAPGHPRHVRLLGPTGMAAAGPSPPKAGILKASPSDTGLPWAVALGPIEDPSVMAAFQTRRRMLSIGLAAILLLLAGGSYFLWRVVERELAVARLHTDFVASVSHELRTPLTSLRHVTELLEEDDELPKETRAAFYEALGRNTERLHRLVESLLDFARMENGRKPYDPQPLDAGALASEVVADFRRQNAPRDVAIDLALETQGARIRADRASLTSALWNLLDNAIKYSPEGGPVRVTVHPHPAGIAIAVRDAGLGVPAGERAEIFQRFVRGEQARRLGIKGTGLGLAMASHIVEAHGGRIELDSQEGAGSTFRLVLPAMS